MQRNSSLIVGLLLALMLALGWFLLGPSEIGAKSVGTQADAVAGGETGAAPLGLLPGGDDPREPDAGGRAPVEVPGGALLAAEAQDAIDPAQTGIMGRTVDRNGEPIGAAQLELWATSRHIWDPRLETRVPFSLHLETETGPDGRFKITDLPGFGTYLYLVAESPGNAAAELFAFEARPGNLRDLGDIRLAPPVSLFGVVLDDHDVPQGGAELWLSRGTMGTSRVRAVAQPAGFADAMGRFELSGLGAGSYVISARSRGHAMTCSNTIRVDPGGLPPGEQTLRLASGYTLTGRIVDGESGAGIGAATLQVSPTSANNAQYFDLEVGASGSFAFPGLTVGGRLQVIARADGYLTSTRTLRPASATAGQIEERIAMYPEHSLLVTVLDDKTDEPVPGAALFPSGSNPSALRISAMAGFAAAPDVPPLGLTDGTGAARIALDRSDPWLTIVADGYAPQTMSTPPRTPRDPSAAEDKTLEIRLRRGAAALVRVSAAGEPVPGATVELRIASSEPGTNPDSRPVTSNSFSRRRGGLRARRVGQDMLWRDEANLSPVDRTHADAKGEALFSLLPKGLYFVRVSAGEEFEAALFGPVLIFEDSERVEFDVEIAAAATISGRVIARDGVAAGQRVLAIRSLDDTPQAEGRRLPKVADQASAVTGADGTFRLTGLAPGTWKVVSFLPLSLMNTRAPVHASAALSYQLQVRSQMVELASGDEREIELEAQTLGARLSGRVLINHVPMSGVDVSGSFSDSEGNRQSFRVRTDSTGRYESEGLLPGRWSLSARLRPKQSGSRRIYASSITVARLNLDVPDDPEYRFDVDIEVGALAIKVNLVDPEVPEGEEPKELATPSWLSINLAADSSDGGIAGLPDGQVTSAWMVISDDLVMGNLPAGAYKATISGTGAETVTVKVRVAPGSEKTLEVDLVRKPKDAENDFGFLLNQGYL